jgi:MHS family proline/betaine transporter-like MFS transporter
MAITKTNKKLNLKILFTALSGNIIEYYGFTLFAVFAVLIGGEFFPEQDDFSQKISAFMIFGTGFISRPLGAIFFGHLADKIGRKISLSHTILGMSITTILIAIIPNYASIGSFSIFLLILLRLAQGFFVGGEGPGSALYLMEHTTPKNKGFAGGCLIASIVSGSLLAMIIGLVLHNLPIDNHIKWRLPFIFASILGLIGLYLRLILPETNDFIAIKKQNNILQIPIKNAIKEKWQQILVLAALGGITTAISYIIMAFMSFYLETQIGLSKEMSMYIAILGIFFYVISLLIMGKVANFCNKRKLTIYTCYLLFFTILPIFYLLSYGYSLIALLAFILMSLLAAGLCAPAYPYAEEKFTAEFRCSAVGFGYTLGIAIFGGFTPAISTYLIELTGLNVAPAFYIMFLAALYLITEHLSNKS